MVVTVFAALTALLYFYNQNDKSSTAPADSTSVESKSVGSNEATPQEAPKQNTTEEQLVYLIEEEKLAHDAYTVLYRKYGSSVFGNILKSESTHQSRVLSLLQARNIADPRSTVVGEFKNAELQVLYDTLMVQGNRSAEDAYKIGVAIEEKDIADISKQLATTADEDVIATLEALRSGSENHLRAFNRQL
jgi:hypothetical protein